MKSKGNLFENIMIMQQAVKRLNKKTSIYKQYLLWKQEVLFQKSLQVVERVFCLKLEADAILSSHRYIEGQFDRVHERVSVCLRWYEKWTFNPC